jgi:hypothetical protein
LPRLEKKQCRVRVDYTKPSRILAHLAHALWTADDKPIERIEG